VKKIVYVVESKSWVQYERAKLLQKKISFFQIRILSSKFFLFLWRLGFFRKKIIFFSSWRIVHSYLKKNPKTFSEKNYKNFATAVTSHSNIGGGLKPTIATGSRNPADAFLIAIEILSKFKQVSVNSMILFNLLKDEIDNLSYCPNGVDSDFFNPDKRKIFNPKKIIIGWAGKDRAAKNINLIRDIQKMHRNNKSVFFEMVLVNKGLKGEILSAQQMANFYKNIDFYIVPSWNEGTPNPALEAAASGVPIISTAVGNMPEIIKHGKNGYFIEPELDSISEVINLIEKISEKGYGVMSKNIRQEIIDKWGWNKRMANFEEFFKQLLV